jgi:hypothetical protein
MGHVLVSVVYMPIDLLKAYYAVRAGKASKNNDKAKADHYRSRLESIPTEVTAKMLNIREDHPGFFTVLDRRETMAMLAGGTGGALLIGAATFCSHWDFPCKMFVLVGLLLLIDFTTAMPHLQRVREAISKANDNAKPDAPHPTSVKQAFIDLIKAATGALGK